MFVDPSGLAPFDHFSSADEAADFGLYIGQKSIDDKEEYFLFIFMGIDEDGNEYSIMMSQEMIMKYMKREAQVFILKSLTLMPLR